MEGNDFLVRIKANGTEKDECNLSIVYNEYKDILSNLAAKARGTFSLNVLCLLCRNIDKVPQWRNSIDTKDLLTLTIDCVRETRGLNKPEQVKTLACIYHIHRYVVRLNTTTPPELVLKLSFMAFETDSKNLLSEYCKTYWNILADRLTYIEKLKGKSTHKLLPKFAEDLLKTLDIYDTVQFCANVLVFLVKKLHFMYSETCFEQLNTFYGDLFKKIASKNDLAAFKKVKDDVITDLYVKMSDCIYVVAENSSKSHFKGSVLSSVVKTAITLLGHRSDIFHCLQTFYLNSFCDIFENKVQYIDATFKNLKMSCEITEKLGYKSTMLPTYTYMNQFLRLFIEYSVNNSIKNHFTEEIQVNCLHFMQTLIRELKNCDQLLKCENCKVKTGLHDSLRLSFLVKHFVTHSLKYNTDITNNQIPLYSNIIDDQYRIMSALKTLGCINYEKCYRKLQTDTHNTAILLNKNQKYEFSIQLFDIYLKNELSLEDSHIELKNISRAFYNKSICQLDYMKHDEALIDAFLSLVFSEELSSDKYMSLVMDIKAKALKLNDDDDEEEKNSDLQLMSVLVACEIAVDKNMYGNLGGFLKKVKFSSLLKHEYEMYAKLWPSILPIAGVWKSLHRLMNKKHKEWVRVENEEVLLWTLLEVVSLTPTAVRTIHSNEFKLIVTDLLHTIDKMPEPLPIDVRVAHTTLLFLKSEYDIADASAKYGWKITETNIDPDNTPVNRTLAQEFEAIQRALQAVEIWTEIATHVSTVSNMTCLHSALRLAQIFVQQLLHFSFTAYGLQLAHICCTVADKLGDREAYIRNAGVLLYHMDRQTEELQHISTNASAMFSQLVNSVDTIETALIFVCDAAMFYNRIGSVGAAAKLIQLAQTKILTAYDKHPEINLELAVARLMEAQTLVCPGSGLSVMTAVNNTQRHYLAVGNNATKWWSRRLRSCTVKHQLSSSSLRCVRACAALRVLRRARCACAVALPAAGAAHAARLYAHTLSVHHVDHAQVKIDNRLKYTLGLQPSTDSPLLPSETKLPAFVPKQDFETMLESQVYKCQVSPTRKYIAIPGYKTPEFLKHSNCTCYACMNMCCSIISYLTNGLEATIYFRANEIEIASNYFKGVINSFVHFDGKLKNVLKTYADLDFEKYIIDFTRNLYENEFRKVKLEILIEASFFELKNNNFDVTDDYIVTIHENLDDMTDIDGYLKNEIMNLMVASAKVRNVVKKQKEFDLENEFENLKISPKGEPPKTPEFKTKPPAISAKKVKEDELPKKRKVIKLNLDEGSSDEKDEKPKTRRPVKSEFKIPVPVLSKPVLEAMTPRSTRKKDITTKLTVATPKTDKINPKSMKNPDIVITDTTQTPKIDNDKNIEFFTPQSTPDQFFTPLNTIKTYSKTSLRRGIVKNLENEFATPKILKETPATKNVKENPVSTKTGLLKDNSRSKTTSKINDMQLPPTSSRTEKKTVVTSKDNLASSRRREEKDRALRRAVSPGKLTESATRPRRLRQPKLDE